MSAQSGQYSESHGLHRGQAPMSDSCSSRGDSYGYPFATLAPSQAGAASRRQSMTVQHMLNPSNEEPRRPSHSLCSQSSDNDSDRHRPNSKHDSNALSSGSHFHNASQSRRSGRGQIRGANYHTNRQVKRRANRHQSLSSSASEAGENDRRAFRKTYTEEETHFIW